MRPSNLTKRPAVFLDRDGVLLRYVRLLTEARDMELLPGAASGLKALREAGYALVVITNQSVVARGLITEAELQELHTVLEQQLEAEGVTLDAIYYCPHHPEAEVPEYRIVCECRKPGTLLIRRAAAELNLDLSRSFFIGDEARDIEAGTNAGLKTIFISTSLAEETADYTATNLKEASSFILNL